MITVTFFSLVLSCASLILGSFDKAAIPSTQKAEVLNCNCKADIKKRISNYNQILTQTNYLFDLVEYFKPYPIDEEMHYIYSFGGIHPHALNVKLVVKRIIRRLI